MGVELTVESNLMFLSCINQSPIETQEAPVRTCVCELTSQFGSGLSLSELDSGETRRLGSLLHSCSLEVCDFSLTLHVGSHCSCARAPQRLRWIFTQQEDLSSRPLHHSSSRCKAALVLGEPSLLVTPGARIMFPWQRACSSLSRLQDRVFLLLQDLQLHALQQRLTGL